MPILPNEFATRGRGAGGVGQLAGKSFAGLKTKSVCKIQIWVVGSGGREDGMRVGRTKTRFGVRGGA